MASRTQRSRRRRASRRDGLTGGVLIILGVTLLAALSAFAYWVRASHDPPDATTLCPRSGPIAVHIILIDRSDPLTGLQVQYVRQKLTQAAESAATRTRFDIYSFDGDGRNEVQPLFGKCKPKSKAEANGLFENPDKVEEIARKFSRDFDRSIEGLLTTSTRPSSPIIESLMAATRTSFGPLSENGPALHVTLISDMVQHSAAISHVRSPPSFEELSRSPAWPGLRPRLRGAKVDIHYALRPSAAREGRQIQNRGHQAFWAQLITHSGGQLLAIEPF